MNFGKSFQKWKISTQNESQNGPKNDFWFGNVGHKIVEKWPKIAKLPFFYALDF